MWRSHDEFKSTIQPDFYESLVCFNAMSEVPTLKRIVKLGHLIDEFKQALRELDDFWRASRRTEARWPSGRAIAIRLATSIDGIYLYSRPLADSPAGARLAGERRVALRWADEAVSGRLPMHAELLIEAANHFLDAVDEHLEQAGGFVLSSTEELPSHLRVHFIDARDLFSIEKDELAGFSALRGLEATLRQIVRDRRVDVTDRNISRPLHEADLRDLVEASTRLRWTSTDEPLCSQREAQLLHVLRVARNAVAHPPSAAGTTRTALDSSTETASLAAKFAAHLWADASDPSRQLAPSPIQRQW